MSHESCDTCDWTRCHETLSDTLLQVPSMHFISVYCLLFLLALLPIAASDVGTLTFRKYVKGDEVIDDRAARWLAHYTTKDGGADGLHIQIASDLHLEFYNDDAWPRDLIVPCAPVSALLGDIGTPVRKSYRDFLLQQAAQFELVILLAGNHEYYQAKSSPVRQTVSGVRNEILYLTADIPNIIFLDDEAMMVNGVRIIGATLWAYIAEEQHDAALAKMNDYGKILSDYDGPITPRDTNAWFDDSVRFITSHIIYSTVFKEANSIVLTHHAPSMVGTSDPMNAPKSGLGYASSLEHMFREARVNLFHDAPDWHYASNIAFWCFGHTHYAVNTTMNGTRLLSNPLGYPGSLVKEYDRAMTFRVSNKK